MQNWNKSNLPKIVLDWAPTHSQALGEPPLTADQDITCERTVPPDWSGDETTDTPDGLYFYDQASRIVAGAELHKSLSDSVFDDLKDKMWGTGGAARSIADAIDNVSRDAFIAAAIAGPIEVINLLRQVLEPDVVAVLDVAFATQLIQLLVDMPETVANQIVNAFAFGCYRGFPSDGRCVDAAGNEIGDINSSNWKDAPGAGVAVSPDNIHMFWDAPGTALPDALQGLYGFNTPVQKFKGFVREPVCELVPSTGQATIKGHVLLSRSLVADSVPAPGAYVSVGCQYVIAQPDGTFSLTVRSGGQYKVVARLEVPPGVMPEFPSGVILYGEQATGKEFDPPIAAGAEIEMDIVVIPPPACMRQVVVEGKIHIDDVYLTGVDHSDPNDEPFRKTLYVQYGVAVFDSENDTWVVADEGPEGRWDSRSVGVGGGGATGVLDINVTANQGFDVDVTLTGTLNPKSDNLKVMKTKNVPPGATVSIDEFDLDTGGLFPDRAYFRDITITNLALQGY